MEEKILSLLASNGAMKIGDIATAIGEQKPLVDKSVKALVKEEKVFSPKRCFYDVVAK